MQKTEKLPVTFAKNDVEIIARETLYSGFFSMDLYRFRHRLFNGEMSGEIKREIFERGHAAVLLPFDPVRDEVVLVEQIRIAAYDVSESPWLLEMVAGMIEEGESVEDVARREALEEAGLVVGRKNPCSAIWQARVAQVNAYPLWWAKWTPRPRKGSTVWQMKTKIFGFMW